MLEPVSVWKNSLRALPQVATGNWTANFANWANERSTAKLQLTGIGGPVQFTFNRGVFLGEMQRASATAVMQPAAVMLSQAWEKAVLASNLTVTPGCFLGAPVPPTLWTVVSSMIDPSSVSAGKMQLFQMLNTAPQVPDLQQSVIGEAFRTAFLSVTATITGINAMPIPGPLVAPCIPAC